MFFDRVIRKEKPSKPKLVLEIRVVKTGLSCVELEVESNLFEGTKVEILAKDDIWGFDMGKPEEIPVKPELKVTYQALRNRITEDKIKEFLNIPKDAEIISVKYEV